MTNKKSTKRALLMSVLSVLMCVAMLASTTFAWFTDSVTSSGNIIKAGSLDVTLEYKNSLNDEAWLDASQNAIFNYQYWEPGYTEVKYVKVSNVGDLAFRFRMSIVPNVAPVEGEYNLADVIDVYCIPVDDGFTAPTKESLADKTPAGTLTDLMNDPDGAAYGIMLPANGKGSNNVTVTEADEAITTVGDVTYCLVLKMRENADNNYQNLSVGKGFSVVLLATQYTYENDSFDSDYDKDSLFPGTSAPSLLGDEAITLVTEGDTPATVVLPAELVSAIDDDNVTEVSIDSSIPKVETDEDGNVSVVYDTFEIVDQNGNAIDLSGNTTAIAVKLYVGTAYAGKYATVAHDGALIANAIVDADGYVSYNTTHFCKISLALADEAPEAGMEDVKNEEAEDLDKLVQVLVGNHYYTVSQGMANSWKTLSNAEQIVADVYVPEDLIAYAMMYNNGDITAETGVHSNLTLKSNLDYTGYNWVPIGRFFTNIYGESHTISNINDSFLGCVYDCQIENLTLENVTAAGSAAGVLGKELAGDIFATNVTIAGENTVTYVKDNATNWPEEGTGVGAICGISLIGCAGQGALNVTVTGTITVNYNDIYFGNNTNLENLGVSREFGLNIYKENMGAKVTVAEGGSIVTEGVGHLYDSKIADGFYQDKLNDGKYFAVDSAEGLASFATDVNGGNTYKGMTITLIADIDLDNMAWTPIGVNGFSGTFDGQGHTVSNYTVTAENSAGLFGYLLNGGNIKNLTVKNAVVSANDYAGAILGRGYTDVVNCHAENVKVTVTPYFDEAKGVYDGGAKAGAVVGQLLEGSGNTIVNCTAKNVEIIGYRDLGGVLGMAHNNNEVKGCSAENVTIQYLSVDGVYDDGKTPNQNAGAIVGRIQSTATVDFTDATNANFTLVTSAASAEELLSALGGKTANVIVNLTENIAMDKTFAKSNASFTLNGNGHTITMTDDATNTYALFDITRGAATIKNVTFDGIQGGAVVRTVGADFNMDSVTIKNCTHTQQQGLLRLLGNSTITNSTFADNICTMVISQGYDTDDDVYAMKVQNCVFEENNCNATAVLYYAHGEQATIDGNKFVNNTVTSAGNAATLYMGFTENNVITNNVFDGNNVTTTHATSKRATGGLMIGYEATITGNAFVNNTITAEGRQLGNDVCASAYFNDIDLSGNYWGGSAPVENDDYYNEYPDNHRVIINDYLTTYGN